MLTPKRLRSFLAAPLVAAALLLGLTACEEADYRPNAIGQEGVVTVVMDSARWQGAVGEAAREALAPPIGTLPAPEPAFDLRHINLTSSADLDRIQKQKNVVIVAPLSDSTNEASFLRGRFSGDALASIQDGAVVEKPNLWRQEQAVYYVTAGSPEALIETLRQRGTTIRTAFNAITRERTEDEMFEKGRQPEIEEQLMEKHGFAINIQHDYIPAIDTVVSTPSGEAGFVWLRRLLQDTRRELFIYYVENASPSMLTPDWIYQTRDSLAAQYLRGAIAGAAFIDQRRTLETEEIDFLDRYGYETRGLWYFAEEGEGGERRMLGGGGPFLNYAFYDQQQDRLYMIDGMVFAPSFDKREFLRQIEVIAHTFRTRPEATDNQQVAENTEAAE